MGAAGFCLGNAPVRPLETQILPLHAQDFLSPSPGQERGEQGGAQIDVGLLGDGGKEPRQFLGLDKAIAGFLSEELDPCRGVFTMIEALVPRKIKHLPKQGDGPVRAVGRRRANRGVHLRDVLP